MSGGPFSAWIGEQPQRGVLGVPLPALSFPHGSCAPSSPLRAIAVKRHANCALLWHLALVIRWIYWGRARRDETGAKLAGCSFEVRRILPDGWISHMHIDHAVDRLTPWVCGIGRNVLARPVVPRCKSAPGRLDAENTRGVKVVSDHWDAPIKAWKLRPDGLTQAHPCPFQGGALCEATQIFTPP